MKNVQAYKIGAPSTTEEEEINKINSVDYSNYW